jgi:VanZ family protein
MRPVLRWLPAILVMAVIFAFSSTPSDELPRFGFWDLVVKKGGHMLGYGLLALAYLFALAPEAGGQGTGGRGVRPYVAAILMTILYALSDEFHQSFVPGRHPSLVDALVVDQAGAGLALLAARLVRKKKK